MNERGSLREASARERNARMGEVVRRYRAWHDGDEHGSDADFNALIRELSPALQSVVEKIVGDEQRAEDIVQETWILVIQNIDKLNHPEFFRAWVYRIAVNVAKDALRKESSQRAVLFSDVHEGGFGKDDGGGIDIEDYRGPSAEPLEVAEWMEQFLGLAERVLPRRQFEVLSKSAAGKTGKQIAEELGIKIGTVKSQLHAALATLKEECLRKFAA